MRIRLLSLFAASLLLAATTHSTAGPPSTIQRNVENSPAIGAPTFGAAKIAAYAGNTIVQSLSTVDGRRSVGSPISASAAVNSPYSAINDIYGRDRRLADGSIDHQVAAVRKSAAGFGFPNTQFTVINSTATT